MEFLRLAPSRRQGPRARRGLALTASDTLFTKMTFAISCAAPTSGAFASAVLINGSRTKRNMDAPTMKRTEDGRKRKEGKVVLEPALRFLERTVRGRRSPSDRAPVCAAGGRFTIVTSFDGYERTQKAQRPRGSLLKQVGRSGTAPGKLCPARGLIGSSEAQ